MERGSYLPTVAIVDYGMGNLRSVSKALELGGARVLISGEKEKLKGAQGIVLPGVGAFGRAFRNLKSKGLIPFLEKIIREGKPFLGICLGLQLLFEESEEGAQKGFGIFPGKVKKFPFPPKASLKIPHMGWNGVKIVKKSPFLEGIEEGTYFYFVHSFYVEVEDENLISTTSFYGKEFVSSISLKNLFASQFHPEKSGEAGLKLLKNFLQVVKRCSTSV